LTSDELAGVHPEVAVVMACGFRLDRSLDEVKRANLLEMIGGECWVVDGNAYFSRPGPRLVDSVEILAGILHPDRVALPSPQRAVRLR
jgi:iron complex transport system substrate-binding protein